MGIIPPAARQWQRLQDIQALPCRRVSFSDQPSAFRFLQAPGLTGTRLSHACRCPFEGNPVSPTTGFPFNGSFDLQGEAQCGITLHFLFLFDTSESFPLFYFFG